MGMQVNKGTIFKECDLWFQRHQNQMDQPETGIIRIYPQLEGISNVGGRPGLNVDFGAVCDAVLGAWNGSGETITDVSGRVGVSRGWIHKWVYPVLRAPSNGERKS